MRIVVTGGAGFVGRHLVQALVADGHDVRILDTLSEQIHGPAAAVPPQLAGAELVRGDIRDTTLLATVLTGVDAVVHLAAETGVGQSMYDVERYVDVNDRGTASLLQTLLRPRRPVRVVLASSRAVYGEGLYRCPCCGEVAPPGRDPAALREAAWEPVCPRCGGAVAAIATHEDAPLQPGSVYAATKAAQERLVRIVGSAYAMPTTILRYFNVYGPGQSLSNPYTGILSTFYARARSGKAIDVYEDGRESRDFVYIDDVVAATRQSLALSPEDGQTQVINVGTGVPVTIGDLARILLDLGGWDVPINVTGAFRVGDVRHAFADTTRMRRLLPGMSITPLAEGLRYWLRWAEASEVHDATEVAMSRLMDKGLYRTGRER